MHFNTLEKYPPVLNFISDVLIAKSFNSISVFSTKNNSPFSDTKYDSVTIWRFGSIVENYYIRYVTYLYFNLLSTIILIINRPDTLVVYETLSVLPAYIYSRIYKNKKIHLHFHEYTSLAEKAISTRYMRFLYKFENVLLKTYTCSHTNEDRKALFINEYPNLNTKSILVFPNLPPSYWLKNFGSYKRININSRIKLVYVGALDFETMYLEEILNLVKSNPDRLELSLFTSQLSEKTKNRINEFTCDNIFLKGPIFYDKLPLELIKYDIGLVLYKGTIPNHMFSIPNKVYEYLYCGLQIVIDNNIASTARLDICQVRVVNFSSLDLYQLENILLTVSASVPDFSSFQKLINAL